jgi:chromosome segregation ATPase
VTHEKNEANRQQAKKFFELRKQNEDALRDQIDKLNSDLETAQKQKRVLASELKKTQNFSNEQSKTIAKAKTHYLAYRMINEAYQTIAMNAVPLNLQQYIGVASDEQWIGYAQMAAERNAYNVIKTIASIPALMKIEKVASIVHDYSQAMELAKNNK